LEIQTIKLQKNNNYTQEEIGNKIGWSRGKVNQYTTILNKIDTPILDIARKHQKDRVSKIDTDVSYDFTEGWFRKDDYTQEEIGNKIGWSRGLIANYSALLSNIVEEVIEIARNYKEGRSTKNVEGTTFIFTQNWFRTVGVEVK
jgi:transcriptional regulator with XRE-family HTH domain